MFQVQFDQFLQLLVQWDEPLVPREYFVCVYKVFKICNLQSRGTEWNVFAVFKSNGQHDFRGNLSFKCTCHNLDLGDNLLPTHLRRL